MIDYVNVKKPSPLKMRFKRNSASIRWGIALVALVLFSMLGAG